MQIPTKMVHPIMQTPKMLLVFIVMGHAHQWTSRCLLAFAASW